MPLLSGCADPTDDALTPEPFPLELYRFAYPGSDVAVQGVDHAWLLRLHNPTNITFNASIVPFGIETAKLGPLDRTDAGQGRFFWSNRESGADVPGPAMTLAPGESGPYLVQVTDHGSEEGTIPVGFQALVVPVGDTTPYGSYIDSWNVTVQDAGTPVAPDDHVQTATVGVWAENGTSFYTNIAELLADPDMPAGGTVDRDGGTAPLPVYVYDQSGDEQPAGSKDTCHSVTIPGYNALLKTQAEGSTGVRFLQPEEAYTRPGAEDHSLYGDALIFLNTIIAHDGPAGDEAILPDPTGDCFDPENASPVDVPEVPPFGTVPWLG